MKKLMFLGSFLLTVVIVASSLGVAKAEFNKDSIIGDNVFNDTGAMSDTQIDAFLNGFSASCISTNSGFAAKQPTGYTPSAGFTYGDYVSAGKVIYSAAKTYGLNPQVLIVTLEKEQSLVTGRNDFSGYCNNGDEHKYAAAVGYGCPDSLEGYSYTGVSLYRRNGVVRTSTGATCVNSKDKAGFSQQVIRAAWLLKFGQQRSLGNMGWAVIQGTWNNSDDPQMCYGGPMTRGNFQVCPSGSTIYYDGYRTIDGVSTFMGTGATAALYWYTPHFHGNELFVYFFEKWFGSTIGSDLLRTYDNATVFLVSGDKKYPIPNIETMNALYPLGNVGYVSSSYLAEKTTGPVVKRLIKGEGSSLYFFDAGIKLAFNSCSSIENYGMTCADYSQLTDLQLSKFANGPSMPQVMNTTSGKWFYMSGGVKREATGQAALSSNGLPTASVRLHESSLAGIPLGQPVTQGNTIIGARGTAKRSFVAGSARYDIPVDLSSLPFMGNMNSGSLDQASIDKLSRVSFDGYLTNGTTRYVLSNSGKSSVSNYNDLAATYTTIPQALLNAIPNGPTIEQSPFVKSDTSATVYRVESQQKAPLQSWSDLILFNPHPAITILPEYYLDNLSTIRNQLGPTRLIKSSESATVFMVDGVSKKRAVSSFSITAAAGISSNVTTVSRQTLDAYTTSPERASHLIKCGVKYYVATGGGIREMSQTLRQAYGFTDTSFVSYETQTCDTLNKGPAYTAVYIRSNSDKSIYYVQNGQKRPFSSYSSYVSHGGKASNTATIESTFIRLIPTGSTL